jgi:hypothetical protein
MAIFRGIGGAGDSTTDATVTAVTEQAVNAATSATQAASSASSAASSASAAATSATNAENAYDSFDDRYLGVKASDPALDNDGAALLTGALYFNSTDNEMRVYTGSVWIAVVDLAGDVTVTSLTASGTVTADGLAVSGASTPTFKVTNTTAGSTGSPQYTELLFEGYNNEDRATIKVADTANSGNFGFLEIHTQNTSNVVTRRLNINSGGDISFYEDTGTTPKLFWDASAESLSIGSTASTTDRVFQVTGTATSSATTQFGIVVNPTFPTAVTGTLYNLYTSPNLTSGTTLTNLYNIYLDANNKTGSTVTNSYGLYQAGSGDKNYFAGNVGIGTTSPDASMGPGLHIKSASGNSLILEKDTGAAIQFRSDASTIRATILGINGADGLTIATGAAQTERMRITSSGNVGIGTTTPAAALDVTGTVNATTVNTTNIEVTNIKAKDGTSAGSIADSTGVVTLASSVLTTADINGGTIDGVTMATSDITVGAGKTLDVSAGTLTLANDQISGDKIQGGTIGSTTITTLTSTTGNITNVNATTVDTTNIEVTNVKAKDGTASATIADSTGVMTIASSVLTTTDINGGTIDGVTIGGTSAGAITGTTITGTQFSSDATDVELKYSGSTKLATTSSGVDVTGTLVADGLTVDGDATITRTQGAIGNNHIELISADNTARKWGLRFGSGGNGNLSFDRNFGDWYSALEIDRGTGDISFYDDSGTSQDFYWDASTSRLGLGTTTPSYTLDVTGSGAVAKFGNGGVSADGYINFNGRGFVGYSGSTFATTIQSGADKAIDFRRSGLTYGSGTRAMLIGANGDVVLYADDGTSQGFYWDASTSKLGLGTTAPLSDIHIAKSAPIIRMQDTDNDSYAMIMYNTASGGLLLRSDENQATGTTGSNIIFETDGSEAMRIDSSGNLLVGTTDNSPENNSSGTSADDGIALMTAGYISACNYGAASLFLNRTSTDGDIVDFRKDGTTVGSIGIVSGTGDNLYITGDSTHGGLQFGTDLVTAAKNGAPSDATVNLGNGSHRWKRPLPLRWSLPRRHWISQSVGRLRGRHVDSYACFWWCINWNYIYIKRWALYQNWQASYFTWVNNFIIKRLINWSSNYRITTIYSRQ